MAEARTRHITDRIETKQELVETMFSLGKTFHLRLRWGGWGLSFRGHVGHC